MKNKIYHYLVFIITLISCNLYSESIEDYVALEFGNYIPIESVVPFSDLIEYLELATNNTGKAVMGVAYKKIQSLGDDAIAIKLADRIANVSNSRAHNSRIYSMYKREQDSFRSALFMDGSRSEVIQMWNHLDSLFSEI